MKTGLLIVSFLFMLVGGAVHAQTPRPDKDGQAYIEALAEQVRSKYFPDLASYRVELIAQAPKDHFFDANFDVPELFKHRKNRTYAIRYHVDSLRWERRLLEAILIHEFVHVADYVRMDLLDLADFGFKYSTDSKYHAEYERATDLQALRRAPDLAVAQIELKKLIYHLLGPEAEARYRRNYLTPEEIQAWIDQRANN